MYDYTRELDARAKRERKLWTETGRLEGRAYQLYSDGSCAGCAYGSYESALEAYAEYKSSGWN